jgi:hypothetical protein
MKRSFPFHVHAISDIRSLIQAADIIHFFDKKRKCRAGMQDLVALLLPCWSLADFLHDSLIRRKSGFNNISFLRISALAIKGASFG